MSRNDDEDCREGEWPIAHSAFALAGLFQALPDRCYVGILLDSDDLETAFWCCWETEAEHDNPLHCINSLQWHEMYKTMKRKGIQGDIRKFEDERDEGFLRMRVIATWRAAESMQWITIDIGCTIDEELSFGMVYYSI
jgi:hypothetical protein